MVITKPLTKDQLSQALMQLTTNFEDTPRQNPSDGAPTITTRQELENIPVGDDEQLNKLRDQMGEAPLSQLLEEAIRTLKSLLGDLQDAVVQQDINLISQTAHSIKGACGSLCAMRIAVLAKDLEHNIDDMNVIRAILPEIEDMADQTIYWWRSQVS